MDAGRNGEMVQGGGKPYERTQVICATRRSHHTVSGAQHYTNHRLIVPSIICISYVEILLIVTLTN